MLAPVKVKPLTRLPSANLCPQLRVPAEGAWSGRRNGRLFQSNKGTGKVQSARTLLRKKGTRRPFQTPPSGIINGLIPNFFGDSLQSPAAVESFLLTGRQTGRRTGFYQKLTVLAGRGAILNGRCSRPFRRGILKTAMYLSHATRGVISELLVNFDAVILVTIPTPQMKSGRE